MAAKPPVPPKGHNRPPRDLPPVPPAIDTRDYDDLSPEEQDEAFDKAVTVESDRVKKILAGKFGREMEQVAKETRRIIATEANARQHRLTVQADRLEGINEKLKAQNLQLRENEVYLRSQIAELDVELENTQDMLQKTMILAEKLQSKLAESELTISELRRDKERLEQKMVEELALGKALGKDFQKLRDGYDALDLALQKAESENKKLQDNLTQANKDKKELQEKVTKLKTENKQLREENEKLKKLVAQLQVDLKSSLDAIETKRKELEEANARNKEMFEANQRDKMTIQTLKVESGQLADALKLAEADAKNLREQITSGNVQVQNLSAENQAILRRVDDLTGELGRRTEREKALESTVKDRDQQLAESNIVISVQTAKIAAAQQATIQAQEEGAKTLAQLQTATEEITRLTTQITQDQQTMSDLRDENEALTARIQNIEAREQAVIKGKQALEAQLVAMKSDYDSNLSRIAAGNHVDRDALTTDYNNRMAEMQALLTGKESEATLLGVELRQTKEALEGSQARTKELEIQVGTLQTQLKQKDEQIASLTSQVENLNKLNVELRQKIEEQEKHIAAQSAKIIAMEQNEETMSNEVAVAKAHLNSLNAEKGRLQETLHKQNEEIDRMQRHVKALNTQLTEAGSNEELRAELQNQLTEAEQSLTAERKANQDLSAENAQMTAKVALATARTDELERQVTQLRATLAEHQQTIEKLRVDLAERDATIARQELEIKTLKEENKRAHELQMQACGERDRADRERREAQTALNQAQELLKRKEVGFIREIDALEAWAKKSNENANKKEAIFAEKKAKHETEVAELRNRELAATEGLKQKDLALQMAQEEVRRFGVRESALQNTITGLEKDLHTTTQERDAERRKVENLGKELDAMTRKFEAEQAKRKAAEASLTEANATIEAQRKAAEVSQAKIVDLTEEVDKKKQEIDKLIAAGNLNDEKVKAELEKLRTEQQKFETSLMHEQDMKRRAEAEVVGLRGRVEELEKQLVEAHSRIELLTDLDELNVELKRVQEYSRRLKEEDDNIINALEQFKNQNISDHTKVALTAYEMSKDAKTNRETTVVLEQSKQLTNQVNEGLERQKEELFEKFKISTKNLSQQIEDFDNWDDPSAVEEFNEVSQMLAELTEAYNQAKNNLDKQQELYLSTVSNTTQQHLDKSKKTKGLKHG